MSAYPKPEPRTEDPVYRAYVRQNYPCAVLGRLIEPGYRHRCLGIHEFAHVLGRGAGGSDRGNGVCLCTLAHTGAKWSLHQDGQESFALRFRIDLPALALLILDEYTGRVWT